MMGSGGGGGVWRWWVEGVGGGGRGSSPRVHAHAPNCCHGPPPRPPHAAGAFRDFPPALVLSLLEPRLSWSEQEVAASVEAGVEVARVDGRPFTPHDLKRLQVGGWMGGVGWVRELGGAGVARGQVYAPACAHNPAACPKSTDHHPPPTHPPNHPPTHPPT